MHSPRHYYEPRKFSGRAHERGGSVLVAKFAIDPRRPDLHEHVSAVERPSHPLSLDDPLSNERIYRRDGRAMGRAVDREWR